ncbi:DUF664 domain-containing protein [Hymenobacter sediminis]|uniref:DinB family protein n=1 Tax=Hymenobacter sediminis TaxID=2218621 RepID=UPI000DA688C7|nr:DinB family protein [Hymenobacter sediminis]RPD47854.1 DUF664 domain-containing protein [Hymenobacter sediminis]
MEATLLAPLTQALLPELQHELELTRRVLERAPVAQFSWQPHPKSMTLGVLVMHVIDLIGGIANTFETDELDLSSYDDPKLAPPTSTAELLQRLQESGAAACAALTAATPETFEQTWTMRYHEQIIMRLTRAEVVRHLINHSVHHRGQLSVYLRLLGVPVPSIYGPSADEEYRP